MWRWKTDFRKIALTLSFYLLFAAIFFSGNAQRDWSLLSFWASFAILVFALVFRYDPEKDGRPADQGSNEPD